MYSQVVATFVPAALESKPDGSLSINVANMAPCLPVSTWSPENAIPEVRIIWAVRWHPTGLMPARPLVCFCADVKIPPKQALKIWVG